VGTLVEGQKDLYEPTFNSTNGYLRTGKLGLLGKRGKFGHGTYSDIDWKATGKAMANVAIHRLHWVAKHSSGVCGTSKIMFRWKKRATDTCPRCLQEVEDARHVWKCQDPRALQVWTQAIANLEIWMQQQCTQPAIIHVICAKLLAWQSGSTEEIPVGTFYALPAVFSVSPPPMRSGLQQQQQQQPRQPPFIEHFRLKDSEKSFLNGSNSGFH
jgi:hypothetical protein